MSGRTAVSSRRFYFPRSRSAIGGGRRPSLATLRRLARAAGLEVVVDFQRPLTREERRSLALHEAIARRLDADPTAVVARARVVLGRMQAAHPGASRLLEIWGRLLEGPHEDLTAVLLDRGPLARELRHVTPFAAILSARAAGLRARRSHPAAASLSPRVGTGSPNSGTSCPSSARQSSSPRSGDARRRRRP